MSSLAYQYTKVNGIAIAYTDTGEGQPILFIHGFASSSFSWMKMIASMPGGFRFITIDLQGFGFSEKKCDDGLSPFDQSVIVTDFIKQMKLGNLILIGHSLGGAISILSLFNEETMSKVVRLVLVGSPGYFQKLPDFIDDLVSTPTESLLVKMVSEEFLVSMVLKQAFFNEEQIDEEAVREYSDILRQDKAKECLIAAAKQVAIANTKAFQEKLRGITIPVLVIWGREDRMIGLADAYALKSGMKNAELKILDNCGHFPQEEMPEATAEIIAEFIGKRQGADPGKSQAPSPKKRAEGDNDIRVEDRPRAAPLGAPSHGEQPRKLKMRRLIDRWSLGVFFMIIVIKFLQFLKMIGFKAKVNGWRKVTGIFLRKEHSKFILASFRMDYLGKNRRPESIETAKAILIGRLADFLRRSPACHWTLDWGTFMTQRKRLLFTDIIEAEFSADGLLRALTPHIDTDSVNSSFMSDAFIKSVLAKLMDAYNETKDVNDHKRSWVIYKKLLRWIRKTKGVSVKEFHELKQVISRLTNSTFIQFETLPNDAVDLTKRRKTIPHMKNCSHPGLGLLNIVCRFTHDYAESDLWFQYHHVPVDGVPMQEMLRELKKEWGEVGGVTYPALPSKDGEPQLFAYGNNIFRAMNFISFERFLQLRKQLNDKYFVEMGGPATVSSMIIWGLAQWPYFHELKFVFPVDTSLTMDHSHERNLSVIFIRPKKFYDKANPLNGFLRYQREFNQRVFATRLGKSESHELLELYAIMHPFFYQVTRYLLPKTMGEFVGTAGVTVLKDAEMFVSPISDLHFNGFIALGNLTMPTEDGKTAGAVSICGTQEQIREYIKAMHHLAENFPAFLFKDNAPKC